MGKKSKRHRTSSNNNNNSNAPKKPKAPVLREQPTLVETKDNLRFEDPFVDELLQEDDDDDDEHFETQDVKDMNHTNSSTTTKVWNPLSSCFGETTTEDLEINLEAYKMHHALSVEWPSLSFDFIKDTLGESRTRFPHSLWCVAGTQAPSPGQNYLSVMKLSDLDKVHVETEDDILGDEWDKPDNTNDDDDDSDDESVDLDPCLEHFHIKHSDGGVNRVRTMPQDNSIVSTWSDSGKVHIYNISRHLNFMDRTNHLASSLKDDNNHAIFTHVHGTEGFAMDWSTVQKGQLATGDCSGSIHLWTLANNSDFSVTPNCYESEQQSVEDLQWSPTEGTVLASAECGGSVKVYDIRAPHRAMLTQSEISSVDVNVLAWNRHVANLIATGDDDGALCVWDLRHFHNNPLARFTCHSTPITSVEWHPTDESMLVASDDNGVYIYDLSVEEDEEEAEADSSSHPPTEEQLPAQLLFIHSGSRQYKEAHWHPQITSCCMTTALSGFSVFIPSNL